MTKRIVLRPMRKMKIIMREIIIIMQTHASHIRSKARVFALSEVHMTLNVQKRLSLSGLQCSSRLNSFTFLGSILHQSATADVDAIIHFPMHSNSAGVTVLQVVRLTYRWTAGA